MRMICLGDSITDCGRVFDEASLGDGYVNRLSQRLLEDGFDWDVVNCGMDGFTVSRLLAYVPVSYTHLDVYKRQQV